MWLNDLNLCITYLVYGSMMISFVLMATENVLIALLPNVVDIATNIYKKETVISKLNWWVDEFDFHGIYVQYHICMHWFELLEENLSIN